MDLVIDIGNTRAKAAVFAQKAIVEVIKCDTDRLVEEIRGLLDRFKLIDRAMVSAVGDEPDGLIAALDGLTEVLWVD